VQDGREHEDGDDNGEGEGSAEPAGCDDERQDERNDDEIELVDAGEDGAPFAAGAALEKRRENVAEHRTQGQRDGRMKREFRDADADETGEAIVELVEEKGDDDAGRGTEGGTAPGLPVAENALAVVERSAAVDWAAPTCEDGHVVRNVGGQHGPEGNDNRLDYHMPSAPGGSIRTAERGPRGTLLGPPAVVGRMIPPIARRFVAGESVASGMDHARGLNDDGIGAILNLLGEHYDARAPADEDTRTYCNLLDEIGETDLDACISVKPSQLGLDVGEGVFRENLERIVEAAAANEAFVWMDMEDHTTTEATLDAFEAQVETYPKMGLCLQANLKRTPRDIKRLAGLPGRVRLVKGAYDEPPEISYTDKARVNEAYRENLELAFQEFDAGVAVGSHDPEMIDYAEGFHEEYGTPYEVQMLMGVREDAQRKLAADGVTVYQYAPYGDRWLSYFYRRVMERKENALFALRAVLGR
jgi:proline dehydrogenase